MTTTNTPRPPAETVRVRPEPAPYPHAHAVLTAPAPQPKHHTGLWLLGLVVLAAGAFAAYRWGWPLLAPPAATSSATQAKHPTIPVIARAAHRGDLPIYLDGVGTVQALNMVTLHTRVDGQLMKVLFEEGQYVKEGDLIAQIDDQPFQVQLLQAKAQEAKDQATLDNAKLDYQRYVTAQDAVPKQQLDTAKSTVDQLNAAIQLDDAAIKNANVMIAYTKIIAPISGRMGLRMIDAGNIVHATDPNGLAVITQVQPISVVFTLAQDSLPQVQKAMKNPPIPPASVSTSTPASMATSDPATAPTNGVQTLAYDSTLTKLLATGSLAALDNEIDVASGTFKLKGTFNNQDNALFPNQFVNVRLLADVRKNVVLVPAEAIQRSPDSTFVDVINDDQTVEQRNVKTGPTEAGLTVVEDGLDGDEMVATSGLDRLEPGGKVTIQSASSRSATKAGNQSKPAGTSASSRAGRRGGRGQTSSAPASTNMETGGPGAGDGGQQ